MTKRTISLDIVRYFVKRESFPFVFWEIVLIVKDEGVNVGCDDLVCRACTTSHLGDKEIEARVAPWSQDPHCCCFV
mgnify:CR=1 FL=1